MALDEMSFQLTFLLAFMIGVIGVATIVFLLAHLGAGSIGGGEESVGGARFACALHHVLHYLRVFRASFHPASFYISPPWS